jgi:single-stranded-DNA-specific exonuclease
MESLTGKRWEVAGAIPREVDAELAGYPSYLRPVFAGRGLCSAGEVQTFLRGESKANDPFEFAEMEKAVRRLWQAVREGEFIAVYGDYDADGVSATALITRFLGELGGRVQAYIPNRFDEGYGLNNAAIDLLAAAGAVLILTVDCGIRSIEEAGHARERGVDMIITDHHQPGAALPEAYAVVATEHPGNGLVDTNLAGVGLAYQLVMALAQVAGVPFDEDAWLDLVALGTVADVVPLVGENRRLVRRGLRALRRGARPGLAALMGVASRSPQQLSAHDIGFALGPRINAAGRLESADTALRLLLSEEPAEAGLLAQRLEDLNRQRQRLTEATVEAVRHGLPLEGHPAVIIARGNDYNLGIVGLAASKLADAYYRPALVARWEGDATRGSCRSIEGFSIIDALDACAPLLAKHGGHAAAAGFTVLNENWDAFCERLELVAEEALAGLDPRPVLRLDSEVTLSELRPVDWPVFEALEPLGMGNPEPAFLARNLQVISSGPMGASGGHLRMKLKADGHVADAVGFGMGELAGRIPPVVDAAFHYDRDMYRGQEQFRLRLMDLRPAGG